MPTHDEEFLWWVFDAFGLSVTIDRNCIVRYIGKAYCDVLEVPQEKAIGMHVKELIPNSRLPNILETGQGDYGSVFVMRNGVPVIINRLPVKDHDGNIQGAISIPSASDAATFNNLFQTIERLRETNEMYKSQLDNLTKKNFFHEFIIGSSPVMRQIKLTIDKIADSDLSVLITGETGTGKEVIASALHRLSNRRNKPYIKINCAAIPKELMESELFGYSEGAFSGAVKGGKPGKFEQANDGTLLLDEVGEIPLELQSKLLRVLQEREVERIGGLAPAKLNTRIICSTNRDLARMVEDGKFRQDLFYRINVMELHIPPLRERKEDIPPLCEHLIQKINTFHGCFVDGINSDVREFLLGYDWPGNVRELEHTLERACVLIQSGMLHMGCFDFLLPRLNRKQQPEETGVSLQDKVRNVEREAVVEALTMTNGNKAQAARLLGISRSVLYEKIKAFEIVALGRMFR